MATLGLGSMHHQLLQPRWRTISTTAGPVFEGLQQRVGCSSVSRMQTVSYGVNATSMIQPRRSEIVGMGTKRAPSRTFAPASPSARCILGEIVAARTREEDFGSITSSAGFKGTAEVSKWHGEEEPGVSGDDLGGNEIPWRFEVDGLIHGHVGRFAFLGILLLGVGVGCLSNVGDAEAATNHINSNVGVDVDLRALAMGPEGPLLEEFWDNMRRYGFYFLTVVTGGVYQLVKPIIDALRNPLTAVLVIVIVTGSIYLVGLTVSAMLGINEFNYLYAQ